MSVGSWFLHLGATLLKALLANVFLFVNGMTNCWNDFSDLRPGLDTGCKVMRSCRYCGAIPFRGLYVRDKTLCWILALMGNQCSSCLACSGLSYPALFITNLADMFCTL